VLVVTCSTQHFRRRPGCLLEVPNCLERCRDVTERCRAWWAGAAFSIRLTWPKQESPLTASFIGGSCETVATSSFVTNSYQRMPSICSSHERPPVLLLVYQFSLVSMFQKHIAVMLGHTNCRCETLYWCSADSAFKHSPAGT